MAERYLKNQCSINYVRWVLQQFLDSEEFTQCINECDSYFPSDYHEFEYLCYHLERAFRRFWHEKKVDRRKYLDNRSRINEYQLVESLRNMFSHPSSEKAFENPLLISCMNRLNMGASIEVDFLEWLLENFKEPLDFEKMPVRTFTSVAERFKSECKKSDEEIEKLVYFFKMQNIQALINKLILRISPNNAKIAKDLNKLYTRYQDNNIRFKCTIIPLSADSDEYIELIEKRWFDLHHLSGDLLDIYYSKTDYGKSGYQITKRLNNLPSDLKHKAPIIVLWENRLKDAKGIDISRLDNEQIFEVISCIVNAINDEKTFEEIVEEANQMSKSLREERRPIRNNIVNIGDNAIISGLVAAEAKENTIVNNNYEVSKDTDDVVKELEAAKEIVRDFAEINDKQKERLNQIIDEAQKAIKDDSKPRKEAAKTRFSEAIDLIGVGGKLISALSALTNVLKFFGISPG